jgi:hypothetical protein
MVHMEVVGGYVKHVARVRVGQVKTYCVVLMVVSFPYACVEGASKICLRSGYLLCLYCVVNVASCAVPVGNASWMFQEGRSSNFRLRWGVGHAAHTRNNPHVKCSEVY